MTEEFKNFVKYMTTKKFLKIINLFKLPMEIVLSKEVELVFFMEPLAPTFQKFKDDML